MELKLEAKLALGEPLGSAIYKYVSSLENAIEGMNKQIDEGWVHPDDVKIHLNRLVTSNEHLLETSLNLRHQIGYCEELLQNALALSKASGLTGTTIDEIETYLNKDEDTNTGGGTTCPR